MNTFEPRDGWNQATPGKPGQGMSFMLEETMKNYAKAHPESVREMVIDSGDSFLFDPVKAAESHVLQHPEDADGLAASLIQFYELVTRDLYRASRDFPSVCVQVRQAIRNSFDK